MTMGKQLNAIIFIGKVGIEGFANKDSNRV